MILYQNVIDQLIAPLENAHLYNDIGGYGFYYDKNSYGVLST